MKVKDLNKTPILGGIFTHFETLNVVEQVDNLEIENTFIEFNDLLSREQQKHYWKSLTLPTDSIDEAFQSMIKHSIDMSTVHRSPMKTINNQTLTLSTGLIKLANIKHIQLLTSFILNGGSDKLLPNDVLLKIECYHSRTLEVKKSYQEKCLTHLLTRKKDNELIKTTTWLSLEKDAVIANKPNILVLVIASPIIDTGRDFDFDFVLTEFRDHRSLIQTAGRHLRHRQLKQLEDRKHSFDNPSFYILDRSLNYYETNKENLYAFPGFQQSWGKIKTLTPKVIDEPVEQLLEISEKECIDARVMINNHPQKSCSST